MTRPPRSLSLAAIALVGLLTSVNLSAYTLEEFTFEDEAKRDSFRDLIGKLRCLVCQNESLASSQAGVAEDLRKEVYRMIQEGQTDEEIISFLVDRYGDFVLYEPPIKPSTYILWFGPFLFLGLAGFLLFRALGRKKTEPEQELTEAERARLQRLLAASGNNQDTSE
ncbi:MAG: cytochrome c-type biogenesis protein CcmH [Thiocapsa sp.]|jgi:cytochrome c-type biogenesis protein CcmH|nr:cytochrome c-type biogenesis protein [Thiocapsa sp.]MCG6896931.1 cytochrome c-type biogenesis protein CcmH [Thiocapsa sp.]MCG6986048.1 cytochrome c-type biogenesis protein CcmH [Thiocapsa sp.]